MMRMMVEQDLAIPRTALFLPGETVPEGFLPGDGEPYLSRIRSGARFAVRDRAEEDSSLKQVIPYGVLLSGDRVFLMRRTRGGDEARLHGRWTIGVGGHVNPEDLGGGGSPASGTFARPPAGLLEQALRREVEEELAVDARIALDVIGVLNDDTDPVGRVHFGVVYRLLAEAPRAAVRETDRLEGGFVPTGTLRERLEGMESWSRWLAEHFWPFVEEARLTAPGAGGPVPSG